MAKARRIPGLHPETSFAEAAARVVQVRSTEVFAHGAGVLDPGDPEPLHDMRVATRRLRAALEVFAACFTKRERKALLREVKALADVLGERRDPDVQIAALKELKAGLGEAERPGVNGLIEELRARQTRSNERLHEVLARVNEAELERRLSELSMRGVH